MSSALSVITAVEKESTYISGFPTWPAVFFVVHTTAVFIFKGTLFIPLSNSGNLFSMVH